MGKESIMQIKKSFKIYTLRQEKSIQSIEGEFIKAIRLFNKYRDIDKFPLEFQYYEGLEKGLRVSLEALRVSEERILELIKIANKTTNE